MAIQLRRCGALVALAIILSLPACGQQPPPVQINMFCVSESGLSRYWLALNTLDRSGWIRYQYMGQDVRYAVKSLQIEGAKVDGRAVFESSLTGETRGNPITFTFDSASDTLKDGSASATCQNSEATV